jgi:hypothetical protein
MTGRLDRRIEHDRTYPFGKRRATRFPSFHDAVARLSKALAEARQLSALSAAFDPFERDKDAAPAGRAGCHRPSVF